MFAIIKTGGRQYRVKESDYLKINKIAAHVGDEVCFDEVLALSDEKNSTLGAPFVSGAKVKAEVVEQGRYPSVIAFKKRRRQNSRRTIGHRQHFTTVKISNIVKV